MTDRLSVATFRDTNAAYDAASAIKNLKDSGLSEFKLKAGVMVRKDDRGNVNRSKIATVRSSGRPWVPLPAR